MKPYTDIFFDFDDTLYDTRKDTNDSLRETAVAFGLDKLFPDMQMFYEQFWINCMKLFNNEGNKHIEYVKRIADCCRQTLCHVEGFHANDNDFERMSAFLVERFTEKGTVIEGVRQLMASLREKGYRLHLASNGVYDIQLAKLRRTDMLQHFNTVVIASKIGVFKPAKGFWEATLRESNAEPTTSLMVGDNYFTDIVGAMNMGIDTVLLNRWQADFQPPKQPTFIITNLNDLNNIL